jgi:protein-tyrosine phosphatase
MDHFTEGYITEILPHLYLGDIYVSQNHSTLQEHNIKHIVNVSNLPSYITFPGIEYKHIPVYDFPTQNISRYFHETNTFIAEKRAKGENVLVHCMAGISRSVSVVLAYMISIGYSLRDALRHVSELRKNRWARPNTGFFQQLIEYEKEKRGSSSITMNEYKSYIEYLVFSAFN